jgi:hypothetical protein
MRTSFTGTGKGMKKEKIRGLRYSFKCFILSM